MQPTPVAAVPTCIYTLPRYFRRFDHQHHHHLNPRKIPTNLTSCKIATQINNLSTLTLPTSSNCNENKPVNLYPDPRTTFFHQFHPPSEENSPRNKEPEPETEGEWPRKRKRETRFWDFVRVIFTSMWWADLKAAVGQRINIEGIASSLAVIAKDRHLALPHVAVPDIRYIDWNELQRRGFKGVVFDKDNTITGPYSLTLWPPLRPSIDVCKAVFGQDIAVFSNSAGLLEYDHDGSKAKALERAVGIKVIRHRLKKPAGTAEEIEKHFGCKSSQLIMVGDRPFTDIVYGNRNGFFTVLTEPLILAREPFIVKQVRKLELTLVNYWFGRGLKPNRHDLLPEAARCLKDLPSSWRINVEEVKTVTNTKKIWSMASTFCRHTALLLVC